MNNTTQLEQRVMRRVYLIYAVRRVCNPTLLKVYVLIALCVEAVLSVSLPNVYSNMPQVGDFGRFFTFISSAFLNTSFVMQVVSIGVILTFVWLAYDLASRMRRLPLVRFGTQR